jgi:hypothetical protein
VRSFSPLAHVWASTDLAIDTTSPIFLRGDLVHVPTVFVSYNGHALDEKVMLLRASQALTDQGTRLLGLLGLAATKVEASIGLEQVLFHRRLDPAGRSHPQGEPSLKMLCRNSSLCPARRITAARTCS